MAQLTLRIPKKLTQPGMYIEIVECPSSEFHRRRFLLESNADLQAILRTSADYVQVNPVKSRIDVLAIMEKAAGNGRHAEGQFGGPDQQRVKTALSDTLTTVRQSLSVASSKRIDLRQITAAAGAARRTLEVSPDIFLEMTRLKNKDEVTYTHSIVVSALMAHLATLLELGDDVAEMIGEAGMLHDLGKLLIPNAILNKPGQLTAEEQQIIRSHPELGYRHLKNFPDVSDLVLDVCRLHHEMLDGSGYPLGLKAEQISTPVRICTVCDVFDALTSARPYKKAWSTSKALKWMYERPHLFDRKLVLRLGSMFN